MKRICLWGTSLGKVADEAQFLALLQMIEKVAPGAEITILARPNPQSTIVQRHASVCVFRTADVMAVVRTLARSNILVMVGGCFMESPRQALVCAALTIVAKACRTAVIGIGVTAFSFRHTWARQLYRRVFNAMKDITVREASAEDALCDLGIATHAVRIPDPRYVLAPPANRHIRDLLEQYGLSPDRSLICVTLRHLHDGMPDWVKTSHRYSPAAVDNANQAIARALDTLAEKSQLVLLPMHPSQDEDVTAAMAIRAKMHDPKLLNIGLPQLRAPELLALISHCDLVLASRLAAGMFSVSSATPVLAIAYENRLIDLMTELGLEEFVVPWLEVDSECFEALARRAWTDRQRIRDVMTLPGQALVKSAWENADVVARHIA